MSIITQPEGLLFLLAFVAYGVAIARPVEVRRLHWFFSLVAPRKMEAHLVPFIIWLTADVIVLVGMIKEKSDNAQIWAAVVGASCIVTLGLFHRKSGWDWTDKISLALSGTGLLLWKTLHSPQWAILFGLAAIFIAGLPIYREAWSDPGKQNRLAWILWASSCVFMLFKVETWTLEAAGQPVVFAAVDFTVVGLIFGRPLLHRLRANF